MGLPWASQTGGWRYHLRAFRYRNTRWRPFVQSVGAWLAQWQPTERELALIGPSAGYTLDAAFLSQFERVTALDPDPVAERLFGLRFGRALAAGGTRLVWDASDVLSPGREGFDVRPLSRWLADRPGAAVLFANVLGQLYLLDRGGTAAGSFARWKAALPGVLAGRSFASYHDRFSGSMRPSVPSDWGERAACGNEELGELLYARAAEREGSGEAVEIEDHGTADLFVGLPRACFVWELRPGWFHVIEGVRHVGGETR